MLYICVYLLPLPSSREGLEIDTIPFQAQPAPPASPRSIHTACKALGRVDVLPGGSEADHARSRTFTSQEASEMVRLRHVYLRHADSHP